MKRCPNCQTTYTDDSLQFCLSDGTALVSMSDSPTVQMSHSRNEPLRIDFPSDSAPTIFKQSPPAQSPPAKKGNGLLIAGILGLLMLLAIGGAAAFFLLTRGVNDNKNSVVSTNVSPAPSVAPANLPNDETNKLKADIANLKKQLDDQKKQTTQPITSPIDFSSQNGRTAYADSPNDGFLALRSAPDSENGERLAKIPHGAALTVIDCPKPSNVGKMVGHWCRVVYNGQAGWAFDGFIKFP